MAELAAKQWIVQQAHPAKANELAQAVGVSPITAQLLLNRGISDEKAAREFLNPSLSDLHSPFLMKDMEKAISTIVDGVEHGYPIVIYGDYDVDGVTATSLLINTFRRLGVPNVEYYIPNRLDEGYGLNSEALTWLADSGVKLVITVDCGVTGVKEVELANSLGIKMVVTDHHQPGPVLPDASAVVNPHRKDCQYPFRHLAGVGVAFKLAQGLFHFLGGEPPRWDELGFEFLDLVALGTIADITPMHGENRVLAKFGLLQMATTQNLGLQALLQVVGLDPQALSTRSVGFALAPRINAMGRMADARAAVELLTTSDQARAEAIARELDEHNKNRQALEARLLDEAVEEVEQNRYIDTDKVLVVAKEGWHHGVIGIVASRLVERYYRPVVLIALEDGVGKGSARSIEGFDLFRALQQCESVLDGYGGHTMAAGVTVAQRNIDELRRRLNQVADAWLTPEHMVPRLTADVEVSLSQLSLALVDEIQMLAPFGPENPVPVFISRGVPISSCRAVGKNGRHLQLFFGSEVEIRQGIAFGRGELSQILQSLPRVDIAYQPHINEYQGIRSVQPKIEDIKVPADCLRVSLLQRISQAARRLPEVMVYDRLEVLPRPGQELGIDEAAAACEETDPYGHCPWFDARGDDKGRYLRDLIGSSSNPLVIWVNRPGFAATLADNIQKAFPGLPEQVTVWSPSLPEQTKREVLLEHQVKPWRIIVTDADCLPDDFFGVHPDLVVYQLPPGPSFLGRLAVRCQKFGGQFHLLYDREDGLQARRLVEWAWPDVEKLRKVYLKLAELVRPGQPVELADILPRVCGQVQLTRTGIVRALEVLEELRLCSIETNRVVLAPAPEKKLDLDSSVRYNDIVRYKKAVDSWIRMALQLTLRGLQQMTAAVAD